MNNTGNGILIVGVIYLYLVHELNTVLTLGLCLLSIALMVYPAAESREISDTLKKAQTKLAEAEADYYKRQ